MKRTNTQNGITLVALIITIVVLLILAAVAIGSAKDSDIIGYAQNAASMYNQAQINEITQLKEVEDYINSTILNNQTVGGGQTITKTYVVEENKVIITTTEQGDTIAMYAGETLMLGPYEVKEYLTSLDGYTINDSNDPKLENYEFINCIIDEQEEIIPVVLDGTKIYQGEISGTTFHISTTYFELVTE